MESANELRLGKKPGSAGVVPSPLVLIIRLKPQGYIATPHEWGLMVAWRNPKMESANELRLGKKPGLAGVVPSPMVLIIRSALG